MLMTKVLAAVLTTAALGLVALPAQSNAQQIYIGGGGMGYGDNWHHDDWHHHGHWHHHGCHWVQSWHHHHPVMMKVCGGGW